MWPAMPWTASFTASTSVGWAKTLRATSSAVRSHCWASVSDRQQLGDVGADQVGADDLVVLGVGDDLHEADRLARPCALPLAENGNVAVLTSYPFSLACASE